MMFILWQWQRVKFHQRRNEAKKKKKKPKIAHMLSTNNNEHNLRFSLFILPFHPIENQQKRKWKCHFLGKIQRNDFIRWLLMALMLLHQFNICAACVCISNRTKNLIAKRHTKYNVNFVLFPNNIVMNHVKIYKCLNGVVCLFDYGYAMFPSY